MLSNAVLFDLFSEAYNAPWKLWNEIGRLMLWPAARIYFVANGVKWGRSWKIYGLPRIQKQKGSKIVIGDYLELRSKPGSNPLTPFHPVVLSTRSKNAVITIGNHFSMTGGCVVAENHITIGNHVMVGANSIIVDTDFHPLDAQHRKQNPTQGKNYPVIIENDVFIGTQALILKGATVQSGRVVAAREVVRGKKN